jgi:hypothetical protein
MANSIKEFKKEINYIFGEVIDEASFKQLVKPEIEDDKIEAIIDEAVATYDDFNDKINAGRKVENKKAYFKQLEEEYEASVKTLIEKINAL